ncbi:MAG: MBL fold metallo-hydrolase [Candidatus Heimdallarchaeota archaeon]
MMYQEISESVVFLPRANGSNLACIALEDELVFFDAGLHTKVAAEFRKQMEEKYQRKTGALILTHGHIDHFFGMGAFADVKVIAAKEAEANIKRFVDAEITEEILDNLEQFFPTIKEAGKDAKLFMPNQWFDGKATYGKNDELVFTVIGGHSSCSSTIYFEKEGAIITGDLMQVERYPYFGEPDTDLEKWINAITSWQKLNVKSVVPGHGRVVDVEYLTGVKSFFEDMLTAVKELKKEKVPEEEVANHPKIPSGYWPKEAKRNPSYDFSIVNLYRKL